MPARNSTSQEWADVIADEIRELEGAAALLELKNPNRHTERAVQTMRFAVAQLSAILPLIRRTREGDLVEQPSDLDLDRFNPLRSALSRADADR